MSKIEQIDEIVRTQTLDAVRRAQDATVKVVSTWSETTSNIPGFAKLTEQWPTPIEVIDSGFDFAQQVLDSQREFASRLAAIATPEAEPQPPKATRKAAAPKAVAAKPAAAKPKKRPARKATATAK